MHKCTTDAYTVGPLYNVYSPTWCTVDGTVVVVHSVCIPLLCYGNFCLKNLNVVGNGIVQLPILVYKRKSGVRDQKQWALGEKEAHRNEEMEKEERERGEEEYHCQLHVGS